MTEIEKANQELLDHLDKDCEECREIDRHFAVLRAIIIATVALVMAVLYFSMPAQADVVTCTSSDCQLRSKKPVVDLVSADRVLFCPSALDNGTFELDAKGNPTCPSAIPYPWGGMQPYSKALTDSGWYRRDSIPATTTTFPPPTTWTFSGYECLPTADEVRHSVDDNARVSFIHCIGKDKLHLEYFCYSPNKPIPNGSYFNMTAILNALSGKITRPCDPSEISLLNRTYILDETAPRVSVAKNGTTATRPIYSRNADNTLGKATGKTVAVDTPAKRSMCGPKHLQDASGKPTMYFEVDGGYALCVINGVYSKLK